jgi:transposase InsO family protein
MAWKETSPVTQRMLFIAEYMKDEYSVSALCRHFCISEKTAYKWIARWKKSGGNPACLADRSRAPHSCPHRINGKIADLLVEARREHPEWGPLKLLTVLKERRPDIDSWPAASSVGEMLKRMGMVAPRRKRPRATPSPLPFAPCLEPGDTWGLDFKGWWPLGNQRICYPLTISDLATRYLIRIQALGSQRTGPVDAILTAAFREHGMPRRIRSDNGSPFASTSLAGLSRLGVKLMLLGIEHERIKPGCPQQNGRHERMHRTLKQDVLLRPLAANLQAQQRDFDRFIREFNEVRPHQALGQVPPAKLYAPCPRPYPLIMPKPEYPSASWVRLVGDGGNFRWRGRKIFLTKALEGQPIALSEHPGNDDLLQIHFCNTVLAYLDKRTSRLRAVEMTSGGQLMENKKPFSTTCPPDLESSA